MKKQQAMQYLFIDYPKFVCIINYANLSHSFELNEPEEEGLATRDGYPIKSSTLLFKSSRDSMHHQLQICIDM